MKDAKIIDCPFFLVGAERSGTTLCRLMLDHHPQVSWCFEFEYAVDFMSEVGGFPDLNWYYEVLSTHRIFQAADFDIDTSFTYTELVNSFLIQWLTRSGKPVVGATVHRHYDRLLKIWPNAKFLHIVRDPRDVASSCIGMGWSGNVWYGADRWLEAEELWNQVSGLIPVKNKIEFHYEDLILKPEATLTKICNFIGVSYDQRMLNYPEDTTYSSPNPNLVNRWPQKLSNKEIQLIEAKVSNLLKERGYELSGTPIRAPQVIERLGLSWQDRWYRVNHRIESLGFILFVSEFLARKLNFEELHKQQILKINEIVQSQVK